MKLRATLLALIASCVAMNAHADAGAPIARHRAGDFTLTLLAEPVPLRAGAAIFSVLVQDADGAPALDAAVVVRVTEPDAKSAFEIATTVAGGNPMFREARVELCMPGEYRIDVQANVRGERADFATRVAVAEPVGDLRRHWAAIALGPAGALVLLLQQRLARARRRSVGSARPGTTDR